MKITITETLPPEGAEDRKTNIEIESPLLQKLGDVFGKLLDLSVAALEGEINKRKP